MKFFKLLNGWGWAEVVVLSMIIILDNTSYNHEGLWFTLLVVVVSAISAILDEINYLYSKPVNHPMQKTTDKQVLSNVVTSVLCLGMCVAPGIYGPIWMQVLTTVAVGISGYAVVASFRLHDFVLNDVKYEA